MSFFQSDAPRRLVRTHKEWIPRPYQARAKKFLMENGSAALFLDPGLGKTSVVLSAFSDLLANGVAKKMLVIAPLRVCELVWRQEAQEWTQFRHLRFAFIHGKEKKKELHADADVYLINPEGIAWLVEEILRSGMGWPFDTTCIDELTKFKNSRATRFKLLHGGKHKRTVVRDGEKVSVPYVYPNLIGNSARRWGLTGTPAPNGLLDLFGQILVLDDGATLGKYITHFRDKYFIPGYTGFDWQPQPGAEERLQAKLEPIALRMKSEDYLDLPPLVDDIRRITLDKKAKGVYEQMKRDMVAQLDDGDITAANAAAVTSKLKQMANGAVYSYEDDKRKVVKVHTAKTDALKELIDELAGAPVLVVYEFNHDLEAIRDALGDIPYLGSGVSSKRAAEIEADWNKNRIPVLAVHPASVGHGLNMQKGSAKHICWFSITWDLELYEQLIRRLRRSGTTADRIMNHILAVQGTVDFVCYAAIRSKDQDQASFLQGLKGILHGDAEGYTASLDAEIEENEDMAIKRLKRPSQDAATESEAPKPEGWAGPAKAAEPEEAAPAPVQVAPEPETPAEPQDKGDAPKTRTVRRPSDDTVSARPAQVNTTPAPSPAGVPLSVSFNVSGDVEHVKAVLAAIGQAL